MSSASWQGGSVVRQAAWWFVAGLVMAAAAGCGNSAKVTLGAAMRGDAGAAGWRQRFPDSQFIVAEGASAESFAQAEAAARAEVSARVQSELSSVLTTITGAVSRDGQVSDYQRLLSEVTMKTSFAHAEMIQTDPAARRQVGGQFLGAAVLSRAEAATALARDYEVAAIDFRSAAAKLGAGGGDLPAWVATLRRAEAGFTRLSAAALALQAVTRREHAAYAADLALYEAAERERAARLSAVQLGLEVADGAQDAGRLAAAIGGALARLGLTATPGCPAGGYALRLAPAVHWESGPFGPFCRLSLPGELVACDGERSVARVAVDSRELIGTHPRGREQALAALYERVDTARLVPLLRRELAPSLPVAER